jgi:hypothetical protein
MGRRVFPDQEGRKRQDGCLALTLYRLLRKSAGLRALPQTAAPLTVPNTPRSLEKSGLLHCHFTRNARIALLEP